MTVSPAPPFSDEGVKILMVDDHPANLLALEAVLDPLGLELVRAGSGEEALKLLLVQDFALILMDVQMSGMDGFETAALIKRHDRCRQIPIIFLTAISREAAHIFKGYAHGAVDYLLKPFEPEILRSKVAVFVDLFRKERHIRRQAEMLTEREREARERERAIDAERRARAEAEAATRSREDVLAVVSHDLRNPLTAISAGTAILAQLIPDDPQNRRARRQVEIIRHATARMKGLISDLLDLSRMEVGQFPLELKVERVGDLLAQTVEMMQPVVGQKSQRLVYDAADGGCMVECDRERVFQVFSNLLGNASKFSPEGGRITLASHDGGSEVRFAVVDSGPGISEEQLPLIFDRYWQARPSDRGGAGL
ncbi:MAG TPA: hybrid sensor histidine kinase/response regulator, partial [Myxococcaceae bacterium]|nr:hybrid sensor histidine kinase/response regulator [Myxococcaceae bacterium]